MPIVALKAGHTMDCMLDRAEAQLDSIGLDDAISWSRKTTCIKVKAPADLIRSELSDEYIVTANSRNSCTLSVRS